MSPPAHGFITTPAPTRTPVLDRVSLCVLVCACRVCVLAVMLMAVSSSAGIVGLLQTESRRL